MYYTLVKSIFSALLIVVVLAILVSGGMDFWFSLLLSILIGIWYRRGSFARRVAAVAAGVGVCGVVYLCGFFFLLGLSIDALGISHIAGRILDILAVVSGPLITWEILRGADKPREAVSM
jgi:hypothetical protein